MKIVVTGVTGQLGHDVVDELKKRGHNAVGVGSAQMDLADPGAVQMVMQREKPEAVIHCAAYTAVDNAEENEDLCRRINVAGTAALAEACQKLRAKMLYVSTDYVFSGEGERPWKPDDETTPLNVYGKSKYDGELAVRDAVERYFIVRVSWTYGMNSSNFVKTMLRLGKERGAVNVVNDQIGSPTYTRDLAVLFADMIESDRYGVYHASNEGFCSWYEFACEIFKAAGMSGVKVTPVDSSAFPAKAKRPKNSRMDKERLEENGFTRLPDWKDALQRFLNEC